MPNADALSTPLLETILQRLPTLTVGVIGDLFLDRYLDLDAALTEPSLETGLDAYQVVRVRSHPGAAGTIINNLVALGVGRIVPVAVIGDDGEGYELRQALQAQKVVDLGGVLLSADRRTPTYTKPMLQEAGGTPHELNRLDIKNRQPLPVTLEERVLRTLDGIWPCVDAVVVLDQVSEANCGVITTRVRERLAEHGHTQPEKFILADSRERVGLFRGVAVKPNRVECLRSVNHADTSLEGVCYAAHELMRRTGRAVFCTLGEQGMLVVAPQNPEATTRVPSFSVHGPVDIVGAGDSTSAGLVCAVAAGVSFPQAAAFGNLVASVTVQQLGTTGIASPAQLRQRWREVFAE